MARDDLRGTLTSTRVGFHPGPVLALAVTSVLSRPTLVSGGSDGVVRRWDPVEGAPVGDPSRGHSARVRALTSLGLADGSEIIASGSDDGTVVLWDAVTGRSRADHALVGHGAPVRALAAGMTADGYPFVASASEDGTIRRWNPVNGDPVGAPMTGHRGAVTALAVVEEADRPVIVSSGGDGTVRRWDATSGAALGLPEESERKTARLLAAGRVAGRSVLYLSDGGDLIEPWSRHSGGEGAVQTLSDLGEGAHALCVVPDADERFLVAAALRDGSVRWWEAANGREVGRARASYARPVRAVVSLPGPEGRTLVVTAGDDGMVRRWGLDGAAVGDALAGHAAYVRALGVTTDRRGRSRVVTGGDGSVRLWDPATSVVERHGFRVRALATVGESGEAPFLATAGDDRLIRLWDLASNTCVDTLVGHPSAVEALATVVTEKHGCVLVSGSRDGTVLRWSVGARQVVGRALDAGAPVGAIEVSPQPDGEYAVITGDASGRLSRWGPSEHEPRVVPAHAGAVEALVTVPRPDGGRVLVSAGADGAIRRWDPDTLDPLGEVVVSGGEAVLALATMTDSDGATLLLSAGRDGLVRRWAADDGVEVGLPLRADAGAVLALCVSEDQEGRPVLFSVGLEGNVERWEPPRRRRIEVLDSTTVLDTLGREDLAAYLDELLQGVVESEPLRSVVVHLDGRWGAGKSSLVELMLDPGLSAVPDATRRLVDPVVVRYDAWRESTIAPEWWSLAVAVQREVRGHLSRPGRMALSLWDTSARLWRSRPVVFALVAFAVLVAGQHVLPVLGSDLTGGVGVVDALTTVAGALTILTALGSVLFWSAPAFGALRLRTSQSPLDEISRMVGRLRAWSPRSGVPARAADVVLAVGVGGGLALWLLWQTVVRGDPWRTTVFVRVAVLAGLLLVAFCLVRGGSTSPRRPIVLVVDDLDRCTAERVVGLLETVHSLLRAQPDHPERAAPFLVVIAADGRWVRESFRQRFTEYERLGDPVHPLGADFVQKVFDHTLLVPELHSRQTASLVASLVRRDAEGVPRHLVRVRETVARDDLNRWSSSDPARDARGLLARAGLARGVPAAPGNPLVASESLPGDEPVATGSAALRVPFLRAQVSALDTPAFATGDGPIPSPESLIAAEAARAARARTQASRPLQEQRLQALAYRLEEPESTALMPTNPRLIKRVVNAWGMLTVVNDHTGAQAPDDVLVRAAVLLVRFPGLVDDLVEAVACSALAADGASSPWSRPDVARVVGRTSPHELARCFGHDLHHDSPRHW